MRCLMHSPGPFHECCVQSWTRSNYKQAQLMRRGALNSSINSGTAEALKRRQNALHGALLRVLVIDDEQPEPRTQSASSSRLQVLQAPPMVPADSMHRRGLICVNQHRRARPRSTHRRARPRSTHRRARPRISHSKVQADRMRMTCCCLPGMKTPQSLSYRSSI